MISRLYIFIVLLVCAQSGNAGISQHISYQGVLTDTAGNPRPDGLYSFTFQFYDVETGGTALWSEEKSLYVNKGMFSTFLGNVTPFGSAVTFNKPYWLGITVNSAAELTPRIPLGSAAYCMRAQWADTAEYARGAAGGDLAGTFPNPTIDSSGAIISYLLKEVDTLKKQVSTLNLENLPIGTVIGSMDSLDESNGVWVLADGRAATTEYTQVTGNDSIPDLRGMFLRGLNAGRNDSFQDPDPDSDGNIRLAGSYQADSLKSHYHAVTRFQSGAPSTGWILDYALKTYTPSNTTTSVEGGKETRVRNSAVYWYVKVK